MVALCVTSVIKRKLCLIFSSNVAQPRLFGRLLPNALVPTMYQNLLDSAGFGVISGSHLANNFILLGLQLYAGLFGKQGIKLVFNGKMLKNPASIIRYACALMGYWTGLFPEMDKEALKAGVNTMLQIAAKMLGKKMHNDGRLLLEDKPDDNAQE